MDRDTETLVMRGINIALLTECIALFFVIYKHRTPNGVEPSCWLQVVNQFGVARQRFDR